MTNSFHCQHPLHKGDRLVTSKTAKYEIRREAILADHSGGRLWVKHEMFVCFTCAERMGTVERVPQESLL
jgi:hypothetical protein